MSTFDLWCVISILTDEPPTQRATLIPWRSCLTELTINAILAIFASLFNLMCIKYLLEPLHNDDTGKVQNMLSNLLCRNTRTSGLRRFLLSKNLKQLEQEGLVTRRAVYEDRPLRVEYKITPLAMELDAIFIGLDKWIAKWELRNKPH